MKSIEVDTAARRIRIGDAWIDCTIGRTGACAAAEKREGDGRTPIGRWPVRAALLRPDRGLMPPPALPWRWLRPDDGWCDDPADPAYNRPVRRPYPRSSEQLWRDDAAYDAIVILGHNDAPPVAGAGSAIFLHLRTGEATEGCVAVSRETMQALLASTTAGDLLDVR